MATPTANSPQSAPTDTPPDTRHPALPEQDLQKDHRLRADRRKEVEAAEVVGAPRGVGVGNRLHVRSALLAIVSASSRSTRLSKWTALALPFQ
jgi:hypothetical protein